MSRKNVKLIDGNLIFKPEMKTSTDSDLLFRPEMKTPDTNFDIRYICKGLYTQICVNETPEQTKLAKQTLAYILHLTENNRKLLKIIEKLKDK